MSSLKILSGVVLLVMITHYFQTSDSASCSDDSKEGSSLTLKIAKGSLTENKFIWKKKPFGGNISEEIVVIECDSQNYPTTCTREDGPFEYVLYIYNDGWYRTSLVISSLTRPEHEGTWSWYDGEKKLGECDMEIFARHKGPRCDELRLSEDGKRLKWTCGISRVYPAVELCRFYFQFQNGGLRLVNFPVTIQLNQTRYGSPPYYDVTCSLEVLVLGLEPGTYQFHAVMPDHVNFGEAISNVIEMALPQPRLRGCPSSSDMIGDNATHTCQCVLFDEGFPRGQPQWLDSSSNVIGQDIDNVTSLLTFKEDQNDGDSSTPYICRGLSLLGRQDILYDPSSVYAATVTVFDANSETQTIKVNATDTVTLSCYAEGNPLPWITMMGKRSQKELDQLETKTSDTTIKAINSREVSCMDTDTYICTADNGIGRRMQKNTSILVDCNTNKGSDGDSKSDNFDLITAVVIAIVLCVVFFCLGLQVGKRQRNETIKSNQDVEPVMFTPGFVHDDYDELSPGVTNSSNLSNSYHAPHRQLPALPNSDIATDGTSSESRDLNENFVSQEPNTNGSNGGVIGESDGSYRTLEAGSYVSGYGSNQDSSNISSNRADSVEGIGVRTASQIELQEVHNTDGINSPNFNQDSGNSTHVESEDAEADDEYLYPDPQSAESV